MRYDVVNLDGDIIGEYEGVLWLTRKQSEPECWRYIKDREYFKNIPRQIQGHYEFKEILVDGPRGVEPALDIRYNTGGQSLSVAMLLPQEKQVCLVDRCPRCMVAGQFVRTALLCPKCHGFLGGF